MTKRILSLLLAAMMVLGSIIVVSAAEDEIDYDVENAFAIDVLKDINVLQGYDEDDFALDAAIKRYEMSLFIARALTGKTKDTYWEGAKNETPFTDLDGFKYAGSTTWTYNHGIILGKDNKTFDPNGYITYQEAIAMVLRAWADYYVEGGLKTLKIDDAIHYPWRHIELVEYLDLDANIDPTTKYTDVLSRGAVAQLIFNLLTFDPDDFAELGTGNFWAVKADENGKYPTMAEEKFGLTLSDAEGVLVEITNTKASDKGIYSNQIVEFNDEGVKTVDGSIANLSVDHFKAFDLEVEAEVYYNIVYFTRREVKENPFTGEVSFPADGKIETVVLSIEKVTIDDLIFTNAVGATPEYSLQVETTESKDGKAVKKALVSITAGDVVYPTIGKDALKVRVMTDINVYTDYVAADKLGTVADDGKVGGIAVATIDPIIKALSAPYADLRVEDTNGDGEIDTLTVVPYVFAAVYTEAETEKADDGKTTEWSFDNYAVVLLDKTQKSGTTFGIKNKDGKDATQTITSTTTYIAKDSAKSAAAATVVAETGVITGYDVRENKTNYITIDGVKYEYKYSDLAGWDFNAGYYTVAKDSSILFNLYEAKDIEDEDLGTTAKYVKAWVLDNKIVAIVTVDAKGDIVDTPTEEEKTVYAGVIDFTDFPVATTITVDDDNVKVVSGKYYLVLNAVIDGIVAENVLLYLDDVDTTVQKAKENQKVQAVYTALQGIISTENGLVFYNEDALGNIVVPYEKDATTGAISYTEVNAENYFECVGGNKYVTPAQNSDKTAFVESVGAIEYKMDTLADDYIKYTLSATGVASKTTFKNDIAKADTQWLFIDGDNTMSAVGIPEYDSYFKTVVDAEGRALLNKDGMIVVFVDNIANVEGFKYSMFDNALYALADNTTKLLDKGVRDGYLYFLVKNLFTGKDMEVTVKEDSALAKTLRAIAEHDTDMCKIVAVTNDDKHELLELYAVESDAVNAIAQLTGDTSLVLKNEGSSTHGILSKADLEDKIADKFNMTNIGKLLMSVNDNIYYTVSGDLMKKEAGMPLVSANAEYYVFYTPATKDADAKYVVVIYDAAAASRDYAAEFNAAIADGTPVIALNNSATVGDISIKEDTTLNIADGVTLTVTSIRTNGHNLTVNGGSIVSTTPSNWGSNNTLVGAAIYAEQGAVVTLNKTAVSGCHVGVFAYDATVNVNDKASVTATVSAFESPDAIRAYGKSVVNINKGATVTGGTGSYCAAVELYHTAKVVVADGATLRGAYGILAFGGTVETAGTIEATNSAIDVWDDGSFYGASVAVTVKGGTVKGADAINISKANRKDDTATTGVNETIVVDVKIAGGTIEGKIVDTNKTANANNADAKVVVNVTGACTFKSVDESGANVVIAEGVTVTYDPARP